MKKLPQRDREAVRHQFQKRCSFLENTAKRLEQETIELLQGVPHIDRVNFRAKSLDSFVEKACQIDEKTKLSKYTSPFEEIEDQVAGRVLVFFLSDVDIVSRVLSGRFNRVEEKMKQPTDPNRFDYESKHFVFNIPLDVLPNDWKKLKDPPRTFEMQVRTLFQHAWAEPQHDLEYKAKQGLTANDKRQLAWTAASAWGADQALEQVHERVGGREVEESEPAWHSP